MSRSGVSVSLLAGLVVALALPVTFLVTWLTPPERDEVLDRFFHRVRPRGAWSPVAARLGEPARPLGLRPWLDVLAATLGIYAAIAATGALLLGQGARAAGAASLSLGLLAWAVRSARTVDRSLDDLALGPVDGESDALR